MRELLELAERLARRAGTVALEGRRGEVWGDVRRLGEHIHRTFTYRPNSTGVNTRAPDALRLRAAKL